MAGLMELLGLAYQEPAEVTEAKLRLHVLSLAVQRAVDDPVAEAKKYYDWLKDGK